MVKEDLESLCVSLPVPCQIPAQSGMGQGVGLVGARCARDTFVKWSTREGLLLRWPPLLPLLSQTSWSSLLPSLPLLW